MIIFLSNRFIVTTPINIWLGRLALRTGKTAKESSFETASTSIRILVELKWSTWLHILFSLDRFYRLNVAFASTLKKTWTAAIGEHGNDIPSLHWWKLIETRGFVTYIDPRYERPSEVFQSPSLSQPSKPLNASRNNHADKTRLLRCVIVARRVNKESGW